MARVTPRTTRGSLTVAHTPTHRTCFVGDFLATFNACIERQKQTMREGWGNDHDSSGKRCAAAAIGATRASTPQHRLQCRLCNPRRRHPQYRRRPSRDTRLIALSHSTRELVNSIRIDPVHGGREGVTYPGVRNGQCRQNGNVPMHCAFVVMVIRSGRALTRNRCVR